MEKAPFRLAISGSSGLVGRHLQRLLQHHNIVCKRIVRRPSDEADAVFLDFNNPPRAIEAFEEIDGIIHLAGESIATGRWSATKKQRIYHSRVDTTKWLAESLRQLNQKPKVWINASAVGFYGDQGDEVLDESSSPGDSLLSKVCVDWEIATDAARESEIRIVHARFGMILSKAGGALKQMLPIFRLGGGGRIGSGNQWMSWISLDDAVNALLYIANHPDIDGPVNITAPHPVTNLEFTKILGKQLNRPAIIPLPASIARIALGQMADELLLASNRVLPKKLLDHGFRFEHETLPKTLSEIL